MPDGAAAKDVKLLREKLQITGVDRNTVWPPEEGQHEVTFALHLDTLALHLYEGCRDGADAWKKEWDRAQYLTGTIDWLRWSATESTAWVDDLKTGHWPPDPKESRQLRSYLLVPWVQAGAQTDWRGLVTITHWEKYPKAGRPKRYKARFTGLDMFEHLQDLRWAVEHPDEVNCLPDTYTEDGQVDELSPCTWCDCRVEIPGVSEWMQNYRYRRAPACWPGMLSVIDWSKPLPKETDGRD